MTRFISYLTHFQIFPFCRKPPAGSLWVSRQFLLGYHCWAIRYFFQHDTDWNIFSRFVVCSKEVYVFRFFSFISYTWSTYLEKLKVRVVPEVPPIVTLLPISEVIPKKWWKVYVIAFNFGISALPYWDQSAVYKMIFKNVLSHSICSLMLELLRFKRNYA